MRQILFVIALILGAMLFAPYLGVDILGSSKARKSPLTDPVLPPETARTKPREAQDSPRTVQAPAIRDADSSADSGRAQEQQRKLSEIEDLLK